jgi:hypothetical protein
MKRIMLIVMMGVLLFGVNAFAAGDLIVNGNVGIGTSTPVARLGISATNETRSLSVDNELNQGDQSAFILGAEYTARLTGTAQGELYGFSAGLNLMTTAATAKALYAASVIAQVGRPDTPGTTTVNKIVGFDYILNRHYDNQRTYNVTDSYGVRTGIEEGSATGAAVNLTNHYHQYMKDPGALTTVGIDNLTGLWIEKQTLGSTSNYGLVLDGDVPATPAATDFGAAIVLGDTQDVKLYARGG